MDQRIDEAAVWQRVSAAAASAGEPRDGVLSELERAIRQGRGLCSLGQKLYRRTGKHIYGVLVSAQRKENRILCSLHALLGGRETDNSVVQPPDTGEHPDHRQLTALQGEQIRTLKNLAGRLQEPERGLLEQLAGEGERRWRGLLET